VPGSHRESGGIIPRGPNDLTNLAATTYARFVAEKPGINVDEPIGRVVGRRTAVPDALSTVTSRAADAVAWRRAFGGLRVPRGVHRFSTHEEADRWLWQILTRQD
jgi:hypothetical protein